MKSPTEKRGVTRLSPQPTPQKAQIESIPGISPRERHRYRVVLNGEILGDKLTSDEAIELAKRGGKA
jgi:hypothetical protein